MKKVFSISIAFLILLSGMHLTFATHYCGGTVAASKISFSGELASCGMEGTEDACPISGDHLKSHCCDDDVAVYSIENTYTPSFLDLTEVASSTNFFFTLPFKEKYHTILTSKTLLTSVCPPGKFSASAVSLPEICIFRI